MCTNKWLETDGFCTACGTYHKQAAKRADKPSYTRVEKPTPTQAPEQTKTVYQEALNGVMVTDQDEYIPDHVIYRVIKNTMDILLAKYGVDVQYQIKNQIKTAHIYSRTTGSHRMVLGTKNIRGHATVGFKEYPSIAYVLRGRKPTGITAVVQIILHEFAHVLQCERGLRPTGEVHNEGFVMCYRELMEFFQIP